MILHFFNEFVNCLSILFLYLPKLLLKEIKMFKNDINLDAINEVYRNANVALLSISNIIDEFEDGSLKKELSSEYEGYEKLIGEISAFMLEKGYEKKEVGAMKKLMMASAIKMNTAFDTSQNHIAELMIKRHRYGNYRTLHFNKQLKSGYRQGNYRVR